MSTKAQLQAVIDGYREELAVTRLQHRKEMDEINVQFLQEVLENSRLDEEAERQAECILDLETQNAVLMAPRCGTPDRDQMAATKAPEPKISQRAATAVLAVAYMLDNRAQNMAIRVGADMAAYAELAEDVHYLRDEVGLVPVEIHNSAHELYEGLTTAF